MAAHCRFSATLGVVPGKGPRLRALPVAGLVLVGALTAAAISVLLVSRDQSRVAQLIEAVVALSGAASSLAGMLLPLLRRHAVDPAAGAVPGLSVAVPAGDLPAVIRGRAEAMRRLQRFLRVPAGGPAILAGMGGAGKSTVAAAFARAQGRAVIARRGRYVWWVSAADLSSLTGGLVTVAHHLGASPADLEVIQAAGPDGPDRLWALLHGSSRRWLLVFDNADDPSVLAASSVGPGDEAGDVAPVRLPADGAGWVRPSKRGLLVVTTRDRDPVTWGRAVRMVPVGALTEEEAARVLLDCAPRAGGEPEARALARRLGGLPLALRLAGSHLDSDVALHRSFGEYLRALDAPDQRPRLLTSRPRIGQPVGRRSVVMRTWEMSLDDLARRGIPQARPLLRLLSCFAAATPIPRGMLVAQQLHRLLTPPAEGANPLDRAQTEYRLEDGLHGLKALSLIDIRPFGGTRADPHAVVVHPVIATTNLAHLGEPSAAEDTAALIRCTAIDIMVTALGNLDEERTADWPDYLVLGPHLHALFKGAACHLDRPHLSDLVAAATPAAGAHILSGAIPAGKRLAAAAASMASVLGNDDPVILRARHELAWSIAMQGHHAQAEEMFRQVLAGFRRTVGDGHRHTLNTLNELAWIAACQQRWAEAETVYRTVLTGRTHALGYCDPQTLITRHELGWVLASQGREKKAERILQEALLAREELLGEHHPRTIQTRHELAWIAASSGKLPAAEAAYKEVIRSRREVLGHEHPDTLTAQHELAWVMALAGKHHKALMHYRSVLASQTRVLGSAHPHTAATRHALTSLHNGVITTPHHIP